MLRPLAIGTVIFPTLWIIINYEYVLHELDIFSLNFAGDIGNHRYFRAWGISRSELPYELLGNHPPAVWTRVYRQVSDDKSVLTPVSKVF